MVVIKSQFYYYYYFFLNKNKVELINYAFFRRIYTDFLAVRRVKLIIRLKNMLTVLYFIMNK